MNWNKYNKNLCRRGSLTIFIDENILEWWYSSESAGSGRPRIYSDKAIEVCIQLRALLKLPLRQTQGLVESLLTLAKLDIKAPCYTQMSRRTSNLKAFTVEIERGSDLSIAIDSTGLKVCGEGEWKVRQHGPSKRRTWRKVHLVVDVATQQIIAQKLTANNVTDGQVWNEMAPQFQDKVKTVYADGAFDQTGCYEITRKIGANLVVPPQKNARMQKGLINPAKLPRDNAIARIRALGNDEDARKQWKVENNYHQRSLAETAMFRLKRTFGSALQSRKFENQKAEIAIKVELLNKMASMGLPKYN